MITKIMQALHTAGKAFSRRAVIAPVIIAITALCVCASAFSIETYVIREGEQTITYNSYIKDTAELLKSAGKPLNELDEALISETEKGETEITIMRAGTVNITADGEVKTVGVRYCDTVENAIERAGITMRDLDEVSFPMDSTVQYGSDIVVARIEVFESKKTVSVPYDSEIKKNNNKYIGETKVLQKGVDGKAEQVVQTKTRDGVVVEELIMKETMLEQPVTKIVEHGTKVSPNVIGANGTITSRDGALRYSKVIEVTATAYSAEEHYTNQWTASGARARVGLIAVDPKVIPLGTRMYITSADGKSWVYGYAVAADTGAYIKGNRIDLYFDTIKECNKFGRKKAKVYILE